jgi:hypothetical protein
MSGLFKVLKEWDNSKNFWQLLLVAAIVFGLSFGSAYKLIEFCAQSYKLSLCPGEMLNFDDIPVSCNIFNNVVEGLLALISVVLFLLYVIWRGKRKVDLLADPYSNFKKRIKSTNKLRVFSSNGDRAKALFLKLQNEKLSQNLQIEVLLRDDPIDSQTTQRHQENERQIQRWKSHIDTHFSNPKITVTTSFAMYKFPVMLSGLIFDDNFAMLAWYSRVDGQYRSIADAPLIYLSRDSDEGKRLIDDAIAIFDCHFALGKVP